MTNAQIAAELADRKAEVDSLQDAVKNFRVGGDPARRRMLGLRLSAAQERLRLATIALRAVDCFC